MVLGVKDFAKHFIFHLKSIIGSYLLISVVKILLKVSFIDFTVPWVTQISRARIMPYLVMTNSGIIAVIIMLRCDNLSSPFNGSLRHHTKPHPRRHGY